MSVVVTLRRAKAEIERRGWGQGVEMAVAAFHQTHPVCVNMAIVVTGAPQSEQHAAQQRVWTAVLARQPEAQSTIAWNDAPERTREEVLAVFDEAIAAEEARCS